MKKNSKKGITVTSIVVYVILFFMFTTITTVLSSKINGNLFNDRGTSINITAINKLEYNLLDSADEGTVNDNSTILTFSNNDEYVFDKEKHKIYKNGGELVDFLKDFDIRAIDDYLKINITLNKYTNEIEREIIVNVPVTNEYVLDGRIVHYDGINNVGISEQDNKSMTWNDLSGNGINIPLHSNFTNDSLTNGWLEDGLYFPKIDEFDGKTVYLVCDFAKYSLESITCEVNVTPTSDPVSTGNLLNLLCLIDYDTYAYNLNLSFRHDRVFFDNSGDNTRFMSLSPEVAKDNTYTFTFVQENLTTRHIYLNGKCIYTKTGLNLTQIVFDRLWVRNYAEGGFIQHSIRVYDRALTKEEIVNNSQVDKLRFGM